MEGGQQTGGERNAQLRRAVARGEGRTGHRRAVDMSGTQGNEKLTAMTGAILLVGFAVECFTLLGVRRMLFLHFFVGMLLIGPVLLKIGSTVYRFIRYYTGSAPYVRKGPPSLVMRVLGPLVILTSVGVIGSGVMLAVTGPGNGQWMLWKSLHQASFILWVGVVTIHVLNYAPRLPRMLAARVGRPAGGRAELFSGSGRWLMLCVSLAVGIAIAALTAHLSSKWGGFTGG
jgi:hypothetical protein